MSLPGEPPTGLAGELRTQLNQSAAPFMTVGVFSSFINLLALTGSIYMLQVYDRVLASRSVPTLVGLTIIMVVLFVAYAMLDLVRTRMLSRIGIGIERSLRDRIFYVVAELPLRGRPSGDALMPVRDLEQIRGFLAGPGPTALFDLPWLPFYLGIVFLLHPALGLLSVAGALVLAGLTVLTEVRARGSSRLATDSGAQRNAFGEAARRNAESIRALGLKRRLAARWSDLSEQQLWHQSRASDTANGFGAITKGFRMMLQSLMLGLGAYLVIADQASPGIMIASSILVSRGLAPIEIAIANWRSFIAARQSLTRLSALLHAVPAAAETMALPPPTRKLDVEGLWAGAPAQNRALIQSVSFSLAAGDGLGIIGPSASGKSTLARNLVGVWQPLRGSVRLDGAGLEQWDCEAVGRHIGYLPQDVELFDGTVAENIARFEPTATSETIIAAASEAGVHELILRLPAGYETRIGEGGAALSAGQRQRIALARALYGSPFLVVLDEPNSNLDSEGDAALSAAIGAVRARGGIVIVIAHRPSALTGVNRLLVMANGQVQAQGPRDEVLRKSVQQIMPVAA